MNGFALANPGDGLLAATASTANHETLNQRWILHESNSQENQFDLSSAVDGKYLYGLEINYLGVGKVTHCL
jgi:hypothetical protein